MSAVVPQPLSMIQAIRHLCAVDLRRFRWLVSGAVGVELVRAALVEGAIQLAEPTANPGYGASGIEVFMPLLDLAIVLVAAIGTAILVQADHPTDDRAFWRTRPIPPLAIAGAKLLSMTLLFVVVPAAINAVRLGMYGAPVSAMVAATLQIAVLAGVVAVPSWFVAVVTRTLPRFLGAVLGVVIVGYFMLGTLTMFLSNVVRTSLGLFSGVVPVVFDWQHTALHGWWGGLISTVVGLTLLAVHYQVRRMKVTVAALLLLILIPSLIPTISSTRPAPADLAERVTGTLTVADRLTARSYSGSPTGGLTARVDGAVTTAPLPADVSATVRVDRITVRALGRTVPAEGETQCCIGAGAIAVVVAPGVAAPPAPLPMIPRNSTGLFHVSAADVDTLRAGQLDLDADTTVTFYRHRLAGTIPFRPGASLRTEGYLIEVLSLEPVGEGFIQVVVRFARFPSMARSRPRLDLFKADSTRQAAWLLWAPWPIATYNEGTSVDNWSYGRSWVGRFTFTIDRRAPLPPSANLVVVETTDIGTTRAHLAQTDLHISVAPGRMY